MSSASLHICRYVLANIESGGMIEQGLKGKGGLRRGGGVRRGERIWQIAFGSGFKCNSAVWRALRNINDQHEAWAPDS